MTDKDMELILEFYAVSIEKLFQFYTKYVC